MRPIVKSVGLICIYGHDYSIFKKLILVNGLSMLTADINSVHLESVVV